ncbi:MAG TPA: hypothetical protein VGB85_27795 [Nannocystis sp.]
MLVPSPVSVVGSRPVLVDVSLPLTPGPCVVTGSAVLVLVLVVGDVSVVVIIVTPLTLVVCAALSLSGSESLSLKPGLS